MSCCWIAQTCNLLVLSARPNLLRARGARPVQHTPGGPNGNRRRRRRPHHRPARVEQHRAAEAKMRRAGFIGHHPPRDKEHPSQRHQSTRLSIRAVGAVDPVAPQRPHRRSLRSPELHRRPRTGISLKRNPAPPATSPSCGQQPLHHPGGPSRSRCAAPESSATTRQGIKNTISPAGNVGERARRRHLPSVLQNLAIAVDDPVGR